MHRSIVLWAALVLFSCDSFRGPKEGGEARLANDQDVPVLSEEDVGEPLETGLAPDKSDNPSEKLGLKEKPKKKKQKGKQGLVFVPKKQVTGWYLFNDRSVVRGSLTLKDNTSAYILVYTREKQEGSHHHYRLKATVDHSGSLDGGHYVAHINLGNAKQEARKLLGLSNKEGFNCYSNATSQVLFHLPQLVEAFKEKGLPLGSQAGHIMASEKTYNETVDLFKENFKKYLTSSAQSSLELPHYKDLREALNIEQGHQDAHEFFGGVLTALSEATHPDSDSDKNEKENKLTEELDNFKQESGAIKVEERRARYKKYQDAKPLAKHYEFVETIITGLTRNNGETKLRVKYEPPMPSLNLPIKSGLSVKELIEKYQANEVMGEENQIQWDSDHRDEKAAKAHRQRKFFILPEVLFIQLKRFTTDDYGRLTKKLEAPITLDEKLKISAAS